MSGRPESSAETKRRLLFVHAHPDDETLTTGLTMAAYASQGHEVHVLTCTLGEEGEVIPASLAHLAPDRDDTLGRTRRQELRAATSVLGVEHSVLGEDEERRISSRYRDSGMAGTPSAEHPDAFVRADLDEAAALVAATIMAVRPDVIVTYDENGGYAHPDHIQTHRVTMAALVSLTTDGTLTADGAQTADAAPLPVPAVYCILTPQSWASQDRAWLHENVASSNPEVLVPQQGAPYPPSVVGDGVVTHVVEEPALAEVQSRALAKHRTQVSVYEGYYALSNHIAARLSGREAFGQFDPITSRLLPRKRGESWQTGLLADLQGRR